ncbi:xin actin-binding repeat-containing protein 1 isoform X2 [Nelusetta ayraudi]
MAEAARKVTVSQPPYDEEELPPPPPPPVPPRPLDYDGPESSSPPIPPPKETLTEFYQQRQKSELKRLFKHIHPDLRAGLDDVVDDDIIKAVQGGDARATEAAYQGEVQSMKWIFENWNLDNIGDSHATRKLLYEEEPKGGDVRGTSYVFEHIDSNQQNLAARQTSVRGDVRTSMWLFETQPLDALNKLKSEEGELVEAVLKEPIQQGDVQSTRQLFESKPQSDLGRCNSIEDQSFLKLKSELQEQKGDIQKTVKLFQADPCCAIRDNSGNIHKVKSICREEINSGNISTARWLFETQPLDLINKDSDEVKIIRGISLEECHQGGVDQKRWMFETQSFDTIQEVVGMDKFEGTGIECGGEADVVNKRKLFETQPLAALKGESSQEPLGKEDIIGGDVKTSLWLFETQPMEMLSDSHEVGRLQKITLAANEQGEVKGKKQIFESGNIEKNPLMKQQEIERGDVKGFKHLFETIPLSKIVHSGEEIIEREENIDAGNVKDNMAVFEKTPLYAIKDSSGNLHKVTTVSREELISGKVQNYKWMFETKPLDELTEGKENVEVIKGITRQEDQMGDVKMAKWLFETQTTDRIHSNFNQTQQNASKEEEEFCKGDVKTCKWLFETQPMDILYDKTNKVNDKTTPGDADVKSITWLFESQPLDSIKDGVEYNLKLSSTIQDSVKSEVGVQTVKHVFETEHLDKIRKDQNSEVRCVSQVNFQSGDVSRVKELFESQSLDEIGLEIVPTTYKQPDRDEHIEKGSVQTFTWMFDNCPTNQINTENKDINIQEVCVMQSGDLQKKKFIFETSSLDRVNAEPLQQTSASAKQLISNVDVKSSTTMFESLPMYAIRDKEGQFHEVTTVKKEEVMSGDVRGARWMFETKPLDAIKAEDEVYVIRAVTQEDVKTGDVQSARWKFETQPLDSFTSQDEPSVKVTEDFGSTNVQFNRQIFESEQASNKFVRMVSVTDVQHADVRTSTWLFENQAIDSLKGEPQEQGPVKTVHREDSQKGDVKRCTWLFESQPLDKIKECEDASVQGTEEEIPKVDVKCTTWLFETTPLDKITASSAADTLFYLYEMAFVYSSGIIIEANESRNVNMAKYLLESNTGVQIQKEEVVGGNIRNIMLELLVKPTLKPHIHLLKELEKGEVETTILELPVYKSDTTIDLERDQTIQKIAKTIDDLLAQDKNLKKGIIIQETAGGQADMSVYSLLCSTELKIEGQVRERGDVKSTIGNLLATANAQKAAASCVVDQNEKGNVNLYKSCIEKGDLKSLHASSGDEVDYSMAGDNIDIVYGDVKEAKRSLCQQKQQVERTISDVLPGDVKKTKKLFSSECSLSVDSGVTREEIIPGDISSAKQQLAVQPPATVAREDIVAGDIKATLQSLERAKQQSKSVEREIIKPGTIYDMNLSAQDPDTEASQTQKEVIISGDVKAAKRSLEMAKQQSMSVEREVIIPGKIYNLNVAQEEDISELTPPSCSPSLRSQRIKTFPKVSVAENNQERNACFEGFHQSANVAGTCTPASLLPFVNCECNGEMTEDEGEEVIRGDVKAAIRSLQSAAAEQKLLDKEDIVRGNVQLALRSLEKSSVNVSKGDYKAAMIYRNSAKTCSERSKTVHKQGVVVSIPPSDTLSPSISVTCEGQPAVTTKNSTPKPVENGNSISSAFDSYTAPLLPQKASDKPQKPELSPKPMWTKSVIVEDPNALPSSALEAPYPLKENLKNEETSPPQSKPTTSTGKTPETTTHGKMSKVTLYEMQVQDHSQPIELLPTNSMAPKREQKAEPLNGQSDHHTTMSKSNGVKIEKNVIQKINAAEEIRMCKMTYTDDSQLQIDTSMQGEEIKRPEKRTPLWSKGVRVIDENDDDIHKQNHKAKGQQRVSYPQEQENTENIQGALKCHTLQSDSGKTLIKQEDKVVLREKKVKETDDERRQRLSVTKEEIMRGNVKAAMEIFENMRKREELKGILSQVQEFEGESSSTDVTSLTTLYDNVPVWMVTPSRNVKQSKMEEKKVEIEIQDDDMESISSVETAFEDLEKASKEILNLKEQTLAKLLDIEEAIRKALCSVSNLKSEADIAGLSGLFDESLKSEQNSQTSSNIRKISIGSSKTKPDQIKESSGAVSNSSPSRDEPLRHVHTKPLIRQSSQSSPSFISIHSAARKPVDQPKPSMSTFKPNADTDQTVPAAVCPNTENSPAQRNVSVLEVKTRPEQPEGIIGTKTVSETYEETDGFGNVFVSSVTSTFFTKQADSKSSALFEVDGKPTRYGVVTSPLFQRSGQSFEDKVPNNAKDEGTVFVTFSQPKE